MYIILSENHLILNKKVYLLDNDKYLYREFSNNTCSTCIITIV